MSADTQAIRQVIAAWMAASRAGDVDAILALMTEDVVFMVQGQPPFGREAFAKALRSMKDVMVDGTNEILEIQVAGDIAFARSQLVMTVTPPQGAAIRRAGHALSIFRKEADGCWRLARDANLMTVVA